MKIKNYYILTCCGGGNEFDFIAFLFANLNSVISYE
jgi:hypothetical protein